MAYLTDREKSILFSALTREERVCKEHGFDDLVKVCKRLTFLFSYNRFEKDIRNRAINEFEERVKMHLSGFSLAYDDVLVNSVISSLIDDEIKMVEEISKDIRRN